MKTVQFNLLVIALLLSSLFGAISVNGQTISETEDFIRQNMYIYTKGDAEIEFVEKNGRMYIIYIINNEGYIMGALFPVDQLLDVVIEENVIDCCITLSGKFKNKSEVKLLYYNNNTSKLEEMEGGFFELNLIKSSKSENIPNRLRKAIMHYALLNGADPKSEAF